MHSGKLKPKLQNANLTLTLTEAPPNSGGAGSVGLYNASCSDYWNPVKETEPHAILDPALFSTLNLTPDGP